MKEMVRQQQKVALEHMYSDFVKEHRFSAQQTEQFFDLLMQKQTSAMEDGMKALNSDSTDTTTPEPNALSAAERRAEADRQLQMLLGGGGYADYQAYEKTTGERMALARLQQQLALNSTPLADAQAKTLLQVMVDEESKSPPSAFKPGPGGTREQLRAFSDNTAAEQFSQRQADLNQRVLNRAGSILKPDQFKAFEAFQKQQLEMHKLGMEMARTMMGNEKDEGSTIISVVPDPSP
jgi:hypothetical protein